MFESPFILIKPWLFLPCSFALSGSLSFLTWPFTHCSEVHVLQFENLCYTRHSDVIGSNVKKERRCTLNYAQVEKRAHHAVQLMELGRPLRLSVLFPPAWQLSTKSTRRFYLPQVQAGSCCSLLQSTKLLLQLSITSRGHVILFTASVSMLFYW